MRRRLRRAGDWLWWGELFVVRRSGAGAVAGGCVGVDRDFGKLFQATEAEARTNSLRSAEPSAKMYFWLRKNPSSYRSRKKATNRDQITSHGSDMPNMIARGLANMKSVHSVHSNIFL